jgi:putative oxidoreductase
LQFSAQKRTADRLAADLRRLGPKSTTAAAFVPETASWKAEDRDPHRSAHGPSRDRGQHATPCEPKKREACPMTNPRYLPFIGRLFIGLPFMMSGLSKVAGYAGTIALIKSSTLPLPPNLAYAGAIAVEVGCGLLVILGYQTRIAASIFCLFCLATAVFFHLNFADPNQIFHFIKNLVMTGGLLQLVAYGAGALSIDNRTSRSRASTAATSAA